MPDTLYRSHSVEKSSSGSGTVTSGAITLWEDKPESPLEVGDTFRPVPGGPLLTVKRVSINDNVVGIKDGKPFRQWQVSVEGDNEEDAEEIINSDRHTFSIEQDDDNVVHSGTVSSSFVADNPPANLSVGSEINIPGVGNIKCTKITGSDDFNDKGKRVWTIVYEGTDAEQDSTGGYEPVPKPKYSFSIDSEHSGSMQVINEGDSPAVTLAIGAEFTLPGAGKVKCTRISGTDEYTENGTRRWTVTYEGSDRANDDEQDSAYNTRYSFSVETDSEGNTVHSGTKQTVSFGNSPTFAHSLGQTFSLPGLGDVTCTNITGSDEFLEDGRHKWTVNYEGSDASDEGGDEYALPEAKYNLAIEKDSDGLLQKSGSMNVVNEGDAPTFSISVGDVFNVPGVGNVKCTKVSGGDDYTDSGQHRWSLTYEGYTVEGGEDDDDPPDDDDRNKKFSFAVQKDTAGNIVHSGTLEVETVADNPPDDFTIGSVITLPGVGTLSCVKVSGSDSYSDSGRRKWTVIYEASDKKDDAQPSAGTKYSFDIENNSDGVLVYSGTAEIVSDQENFSPSVNVGETFDVPVIGSVTCSEVRASNDGTGLWTCVIEGVRVGDGEDDTPSLPDEEVSLSYELNGSSVRTVAGELVVLRRSSTPIIRKTITAYSDDGVPLAVLGDTYKGGTALSENIIKETIRNNGVITATYYKHSIEVEA